MIYILTHKVTKEKLRLTTEQYHEVVARGDHRNFDVATEGEAVAATPPAEVAKDLEGRKAAKEKS